MFTQETIARLTLLEFNLLNVSSGEAHTSKDHYFLSPDLQELWHSVMSTCLLTEVKQQWAT